MTFTSPLPSVDITTGIFRPARPAPRRAAPDHRRDDILRLLSAGHLDAAQRLLDRSPPDGISADILQADITSRRWGLSVPDLLTLRECVEVTAPDDDMLVSWVAAITAERLAIDGDPVAFAAALAALQQIPDPEPASLPAAYTRARLLRLAALATLLLPTAQAVVQHGTLHEQAIALLLRHGLTAEANASDGVAAGSRILIHGERPNDLHRLRETRAAAGQTSLWATALDLVLGTVAVVRRDADLAAESFDRIEQSPDFNPRMTYLTTFGRAVFRLLGEGPTTGALGTVHRALDHCRPDPRWRYDALCHTAHLLLEQRSPHGPPVAATALEMPPNGPVDLVEREILASRVRVFQRDHPGDDELFGLLRRLDGWGRRRPAGRQALHLAHDLADTHPDLARTLHDWGVERLPPAAECTREERDLRHRPGDRPGPAALTGPVVRSRTREGTDGGPPLEVAVLGPELTVRVLGTPRVLARMEGLLVLYLALSHPGTMHVESIHDALWPEKAFNRRRLNTLVHRLRTALGPAGDAVRRTRDQVWLDEERCRADLAAYRSDLGASDPARVRAVASVRGNLCGTSHPFEERLIDERARFADEWLAHARSLIRAGAVEAHRLYRARAALDLLDFPLDL